MCLILCVRERERERERESEFVSNRIVCTLEKEREIKDKQKIVFSRGEEKCFFAVGKNSNRTIFKLRQTHLFTRKKKKTKIRE